MRFRINGIKVDYVSPDIDGDGQTGGYETISHDNGITDIIQLTELGESLKELNQDVIEQKSRMSSIDMRAILHPFQVHPIAAFDTLASFGMITKRSLSLSRKIMRLSVSQQGKGREQIVDTVVGKRDNDIKKSGGGIFGGMFSGKTEEARQS